MGRIVLTSNMTLDGIAEDPGGDEGTATGGWFTLISDADRATWNEVVHGEAMGMAAYLLGGRTYGWFAERWVDREGEVAANFTAKPKYVVRSKPGRTDWGPTHELEGDVVAAVTKLKQDIDGDIALYASYELAKTLLDHDLVDEARIIVFPHLAGAGGRLFHELTRSTRLHLIGLEQVGDQLVRMKYDVETVPA